MSFTRTWSTVISVAVEVAIIPLSLSQCSFNSKARAISGKLD